MAPEQRSDHRDSPSSKHMTRRAAPGSAAANVEKNRENRQADCTHETISIVREAFAEEYLSAEAGEHQRIQTVVTSSRAKLLFRIKVPAKANPARAGTRDFPDLFGTGSKAKLNIRRITSAKR